MPSLAQQGPPRRVRLLAYLDPDGPEPDNNGVMARTFRIGDPTAGTCPLSGYLDPEAAELVQTALNTLNAPTPADDGTADPRTFEQRNADALVEVMRRYLAGNTGPTNGGSAYRVVVTLNLHDLQDQAGTPATATGMPVSATAARRMACDAGIIPVVLGSESQPLDVGREHRLATPAIRQALAVRDLGCSFPTCDRPPEWTEAHHVRHWADGGATDTQNMTLLCTQHHTLLHHSGWDVVIDTDGLPTFIPPPIIDPQRQPAATPASPQTRSQSPLGSRR